MTWFVRTWAWPWPWVGWQEANKQAKHRLKQQEENLLRKKEAQALAEGHVMLLQQVMRAKDDLGSKMDNAGKLAQAAAGANKCARRASASSSSSTDDEDAPRAPRAPRASGTPRSPALLIAELADDDLHTARRLIDARLRALDQAKGFVFAAAPVSAPLLVPSEPLQVSSIPADCLLMREPLLPRASESEQWVMM